MTGVVNVFSEDEWLLLVGRSARGTLGGLHSVSRRSWWDRGKMSGGLYSGAKKEDPCAPCAAEACLASAARTWKFCTSSTDGTAGAILDAPLLPGTIMAGSGVAEEAFAGKSAIFNRARMGTTRPGPEPRPPADP